MAVTPTYPGVYVQEVPSGVRAIAGVGTSTALFVGRAADGPLGEPVRLANFTEFRDTFTDQYARSDLARAVRMFFDNGGTDCYVVRVAGTVTNAAVTLDAQDGATAVLRVEAKSPGAKGNSIRTAVSYRTQNPEETFNLEAFRWTAGVGGALVKTDQEVWTDLSMNPSHPRFVENVINPSSSLIKVTKLAGAVAAAAGSSLSSRPLPFGASPGTDSLVTGELATIIGTGPTGASRFRLSVDGRPFVDVDVKNASLTGTLANVESALTAEINSFLVGGAIQAAFMAGPAGVTGQPNETSRLLRIRSTGGGDVKIEPAPANDLAVPLMLGAAQGGQEESAWADARPAPNGVVFKLSSWTSFAGRPQNHFNQITIAGKAIPLGTALRTVGNTAPMYKDAAPSSPNGNSDGVREKWNILASQINAAAATDPGFPWSAEVWGQRLALVPTGGGDNQQGGVATSANDISGNFMTGNVRHYTLGAGGGGSFQGAGAAGTESGAPGLATYQSAMGAVDREVDLFNLMILPRDADHSADDVKELWGPASIFCQRRRAFLLMDPPDAWRSDKDATDLQTGVNSLRAGMVKDHSAIFFPRLIVRESGSEVAVGPSGAVAGLMARIDSARGVWKAPAGTEADLRAVAGVEHPLSDAQNGVLNPRAVNAIRVFPNGIVVWGARTMDGDNDFGSEYKYIPIRRLALMIEESLYRGLKWAVFEPNDDPLYAQIRLSVGAFMGDLFRKGAFEGATPRQAYFVKCDRETTTDNDRRLGVVNIWVGFAPLKPAEFIVIYLQQMAGQAEV
jgi:uncharacterized protein